MNSSLKLAREFYENKDHAAAYKECSRALSAGITGSSPEFYEILEILSISAFYVNDEAKIAGRWAAEVLSSMQGAKKAGISLARKNLVYYTKNLTDLVKVKRKQELHVSLLGPGWNILNPSIARWNNGLWVIQRSVNYTILSNGTYSIENGGAIKTENFLLKLNEDSLRVEDEYRITRPVDYPSPIYKEVIGFEDCRSYTIGDELHFSATVRESNTSGMCQIVTGQLKINGSEANIENWKIQSQIEPQLHQKNWMPIIGHGEYKFIYSVHPLILVDHSCQNLTRKSNLTFNCDSHRGGSQVIKFGLGWLCVTHETEIVNGLRHYFHRFVYINDNFIIERISPRFKIASSRIEFVSGLAWNMEETSLLISFGDQDRSSWVLEVEKEEVEKLVNGKFLEMPQILK